MVLHGRLPVLTRPSLMPCGVDRVENPNEATAKSHAPSRKGNSSRHGHRAGNQLPAHAYRPKPRMDFWKVCRLAPLWSSSSTVPDRCVLAELLLRGRHEYGLVRGDDATLPPAATFSRGWVRSYCAASITSP
jgi:hypothetical protein